MANRPKRIAWTRTSRSARWIAHGSSRIAFFLFDSEARNHALAPAMSDRSTPLRLRGLPLIGNLLELRRDPAALLRRVLAECGDVGAFTIGPRAVTVVASAELAREVLIDDADAYEKGPV